MARPINLAIKNKDEGATRSTISWSKKPYYFSNKNVSFRRSRVKEPSFFRKRFTQNVLPSTVARPNRDVCAAALYDR